MQFILTCPNGKQIDMTNDLLRQIDGQITRQDVEDRINFYNNTNLKKNNTMCTINLILY